MVLRIKWDKVNKWLHFGYDPEKGLGRIIFMFDQILNWLPSRSPTIREWTLFSITYDNGAWWCSDLDWDTAEQPDYAYKKKSGDINCFIEIVILGIGLRLPYKRKLTIILPNPQLILNAITIEKKVRK